MAHMDTYNRDTDTYKHHTALSNNYLVLPTPKRDPVYFTPRSPGRIPLTGLGHTTVLSYILWMDNEGELSHSQITYITTTTSGHTVKVGVTHYPEHRGNTTGSTAHLYNRVTS